MAPPPVDPKKRPRHQRSLSDKENTPQSTSNTSVPLQDSAQSSRRTTSSNHLQYPNETSIRRITNTNASSAAVRRSPRIQARSPLLQANRNSSSSTLGTRSLKNSGLNVPPSSTHATPRPTIRGPSARLPSSTLGTQSLTRPPPSPFVPVPPITRAQNAPLPSISALGTQSVRRPNNPAPPAYAPTTASHPPLTPNSSFSSSARPAPPAGMSSFAFRFEATRRAALEREPQGRRGVGVGEAGEEAGMAPAPESSRDSLDMNDSWLWEGKEEEEETGEKGEKKRRG